jgi:hypothetical protein
MMPPTKLPNGHPASDHRWSTASLVTRRSAPTDQQPMAPAKSPPDGHGSPAAEPEPHPASAGPPLTPWQLDATALPTALESP